MIPEEIHGRIDEGTCWQMSAVIPVEVAEEDSGGILKKIPQQFVRFVWRIS